MLVGDHVVYTMEQWDTTRSMLSDMVVELVETHATEEIRNLICQPKESDLNFFYDGQVDV